MQKITFKKKWVEKLEQMPEEQKEKCIIALFDYLAKGHPTVKMMKNGSETACFMRDIVAECKEDERRREIVKERRAERKRLAEERRKQAEEEAKQIESECFIGSREEYRNCPALFMFDAFMHYLLSSSGAGLRPKMPIGKSLGDALMKYRKWAVETSKVNDISKLNVFRDQFVRNLAMFE